MPIDFPSNPTNGQVYGNWIYDSNITAWRNVNTDTGIGTLNAMGLKNIVPTSVTVGSGSAVVNSNGTVSFSNATSVMLNGVFTTQYNSYLQVCTFNTSATLEIRQRLSHSGSALTGAAYGWGGISVTSAGTPSYYSGSGIDWYPIGSTQAATSHAFSQTIHYPMDSGKITRTTFTGGVWDGVWRSINFSGAYNSTGQASGIQIYSTSANTFSGEMMIYGYNQ